MKSLLMALTLPFPFGGFNRVPGLDPSLIALLLGIVCLFLVILIFFLVRRYRSLLLEFESERTHSESLHSELSRQIVYMQKLIEIGESVSGGMDYSTIGERAVMEAIKLVDADSGALWIFDNRGRVFIQKYEGTKRGVLYQHQEVLRHIIMDRIPADRPAFLLGHEEMREMGLLDVFSAIHPGSIAAVPIFREEIPSALLILVRFSDKDDFTADDLKLLGSLLNHVSLALMNCELFEKNKRRLKELSLLLKISTGEYAGRFPDTVMERITRLLDELVSLKDAMLLERVGDSNQFRLRPKEDSDSGETVPQLVTLDEEETLEVETEPQRLLTETKYLDRFAAFLPPDADSQMLIFPIVVDEHLAGFYLGNAEEAFAASADSWLSTYLTMRQALSLLQHTRSFLQSSQLALLGEIVASIAHSIRTPLTTLKSFSQMLLESYDDPEFRQTFVGVLREETDRLTGLTTEILGMTGNTRLQPQESSVNQIVERTLLLLKKDLSSSHIEVKRDLAQDVTPVSCDSNRIRELLLNIAVNAIQAMEGGGALTIRTELVEDGAFVRISICDTGKGIPESVHNRVFDPFFTTKERGTGIGLMIARRIVDQHRGRIDFESIPGKGTSFFIDLPVSQAGDKLPSPPDVRIPIG